MKVCFQWQTNGTCNFEDKCKFAHPTPTGGSHMHCVLPTSQENEFQPKAGDLV